MILPFSDLKFYISDFEGRFIPSFVNDIARFGDFETGILFIEAENKTGYVLISGGSAVLSRVMAFSDDGQLASGIPIEALFTEKSVDLYLAEVKSDKVFKWLSDFFVYPLSVYAPYRFVDVPGIISSFAAEKESALLCFKHGGVMNFAAFGNGNFDGFACFEPSEKRYIFERDAVKFGSYLSSLDISKPVVFCKHLSEKALASSFFSSGLGFLEKDPLQAECELYFSVFNIIFSAFAGVMTAEKIKELSEKLFAYLRGKYPQLYSELAFSPETGAVNWETVIDGRKSVAFECRFGEFYRYLDEILYLLLKTASSLLKPRKMKALGLDIRASVQSSAEKNEDFARIFDRFDKLLKIL